MSADGCISFEPKDSGDLARFFNENKELYHEIWVVLIKKTRKNPQPVSFSESVKTAVSHGLVDSRTKTIDAEKYAVRFTKRKMKKVGSV